MNKRGFTLIEVTAVVILLGVIAVLIIPKVSNTININKDKVCDSIKVTAEDAAESYSYMHMSAIDNLIDSNGYAEVTLAVLIQEGLLKKDLVNPYTNEPISTANVVKIEKVNNSYTYTYMGVDCK